MNQTRRVCLIFEIDADDFADHYNNGEEFQETYKENIADTNLKIECETFATKLGAHSVTIDINKL